MVSAFPLTASADTVVRESADLQENAAIKGNNGVGMLLAEAVNGQQGDETANYPYGYGISDLTYADGVATVKYRAVADATVVVAVYTEDGRYHF